MKKILVPTDFSIQAEHALELAYDIAKLADAEIVLLNVLDIPGGSAFAASTSSFDVLGAPGYASQMDNVYVVQLHDQTKKKLEEKISEERFKDIRITYKLQVGNPYYSISEEITANNMNLVVMGTTGTSGVEELLIGSNTEKVVRLAKCPVLTVKQKVKSDRLKNIVFASNFVDDQNIVVDELKKLQRLFGAKLHLVKINTPNNFDSSRQIKKDIESFAKKNQINNYTVNIYCDKQEEEGIIYFADDIDADLIALSTHGRTGIMHLLSGSIAEDVVNHSKRPVWTYRIK
jgi:nucleotide-binding universal stress UspA family protein